MDVKALSDKIHAHTRSQLARLALLPGISGEDIKRDLITAIDTVLSKAATKADREAEREAAKAQREAAKAAAKAKREAAKAAAKEAAKAEREAAKVLKKAMKAKLPDNEDIVDEPVENEPAEDEPADSDSDVEFVYEIEPKIKIETEEIAAEVPKFFLVADSDDDEDEDTEDDEGYMNEDEEYRMWTEFKPRETGSVH